MKKNKIKGEISVKIISHAVLLVLGLSCLLSILLVIGASFQTQAEIVRRGYALIPEKPSLEAYITVFRNPYQLFKSYFNTIYTTVVGTVLGVAISASAGYVMSRKTYKYRNIFAFYVFFTMMFNGGLVPMYIMMTKWFNLKNTYLALILPLVVNGWYIMLMKGYFAGIPDAVIESAKIDGAGELYTFVKIVIPMSTPVIASISLFYVLGYWNDWYQSLLYTTDSEYYKLQYLLMNMIRSAEFLNSEAAQDLQLDQIAEIPTMNVKMAMCVLAAGPILFVFPFFQKYFVKGIAVGSVKG